MNVLKRQIVDSIDNNLVVFEAVEPMHLPDYVSIDEIKAIENGQLVCFTPHISVMVGDEVSVIFQAEVEVTSSFKYFMSQPEFSELVEQAIIQHQITHGDHYATN